jgi:hypothetical protein
MTQLSNCHKAPVKLVGGTGDFSSHEKGITMHYQCSKCGEACDLAIPKPKKWVTQTEHDKAISDGKSGLNKEKS